MLSKLFPVDNLNLTLRHQTPSDSSIHRFIEKLRFIWAHPDDPTEPHQLISRHFGMRGNEWISFTRAPPLQVDYSHQHNTSAPPCNVEHSLEDLAKLKTKYSWIVLQSSRPLSLPPSSWSLSSRWLLFPLICVHSLPEGTRRHIAVGRYQAWVSCF